MGKIDLKLSTISSKVVMAIAGLFLMSFLVVHLSINLLMLIQDNGEAFKSGVNFMTTNPVIKVFEYVLFGGFLIHIIFGIMIEISNYFARPIKYAVASKSTTSFLSKYMIYSGIAIFVFLVIHFTHFYFVKLGWLVSDYTTDKHAFLIMAMNVFANPYFVSFYIICFIFLGFHLRHAFQSAFQTLGLNHPKYTPFIKFLATLYALVIVIGFTFIPIHFFFFNNILK